MVRRPERAERTISQKARASGRENARGVWLRALATLRFQAKLEQERTVLKTQLEEQRAENEHALAAQRAENERALAAQREEAERREAEAQAERQKMQVHIDAVEAQGRQAQADKEQLLAANKELKRSLEAMNKKQTKMQEEMRQQEDRIKTQLEEKFRDDMAKLQAGAAKRARVLQTATQS